MTRRHHEQEPPTLLAKLSNDQMAELMADKPASQREPSRIELRKCPRCREYATKGQERCCGVAL